MYKNNKSRKVILLMVVLLLNFIITVKAEAYNKEECNLKGNSTYCKDKDGCIPNLKGCNNNKNIERQELPPIEALKCREILYEEALTHLGACTPEKTAETWALGVKNRNGILQYALMNKELKKEFKEAMDKDKNSCWVTGVSSPWVTSYTITKKNSIKKSQYQYKVKFQWATSTGPSQPTEIALTIVKEDGQWRIKEIK